MSPAAERARLFFALWPDEGVRERLAQWSGELRAACGGRPARAENLHMTLAFLGSVETERIALVEGAADGVAPRVLTLVLDRPGVWRDIVWAGASAVPEGLEALVLALRGALSRSGIDFDPKPFAAHVTLLRKARKPQAMPQLAPIRWDLAGYALVRSSLQASSSRYEVLKSWKPAG